jgi:hypothetical protein
MYPGEEVDELRGPPKAVASLYLVELQIVTSLLPARPRSGVEYSYGWLLALLHMISIMIYIIGGVP